MELPTRGCIREVAELGAADLYIGREHKDRNRRFLAASKWANPFKAKEHGGTAACIEKFEAHLRANAKLLADLPELAGKELLCHCAQGAPCHGDSLITAFAEFVLNAPDRDTTLQVGVYRSDVEFAEAAVGLVHPFEARFCAPAVLKGLAF